MRKVISARDIEELMYERVFTPICIRRSDLRWRKNAYRPAEIEGIARREFGSGVHASVDAMARIGLLYLRRGRWKGREILPASFVDRARTTVKDVVGRPEVAPETYGNASDHYGLLWWNNADGTLEKVPRDAYWSWGLYDSLIVVIPSLDLVVARAGGSHGLSNVFLLIAGIFFVIYFVQFIRFWGRVEKLSEGIQARPKPTPFGCVTPGSGSP